MSEITLVLITTFGAISLLASLTILVVIYYMRRMNDFLRVIVFLTIAQGFYDISVILQSSASNGALMNIALFVQCFSGMATVLWTNVISYVVVNVAISFKLYLISHNFRLILVAVLGPSFFIALCVSSLRGLHDDAFRAGYHFYNWICLIGISYNIFSYIYLTWKLYKRDSGGPAHSSVKTDPLKALVTRMKYYPIVQIVFRLGAMWYDLNYGYGIQRFEQSSVEATLSMVLYSIALPSAGIGYFFVFLIVTPGAKDKVTELLRQAVGIKSRNDGSGEPNRGYGLRLATSLKQGHTDKHSNPDLVTNLLQNNFTNDLETTIQGGILSDRFSNNSDKSLEKSDQRIHSNITPSSLTTDFDELDEDQLAGEVSRLYNIPRDLFLTQKGMTFA